MPAPSSLVPYSSSPRSRASAQVEALVSRFGDRMVKIAEELLGDEIDARLHRIVTRPNEAGVDPFGFDPSTARYALALSAFLHRYYFRTEVHGVDRIPAGRVLVIANHSGQIPMDGLIVGTSLMLDAEPPRFPRSMVERWSAELPFVSVLFPRCGQVVGSPDNARRLLDQDEALIVFPEGSRGISKTFDQRYQLVDFGLGFMRLALETNTPILPVAVIGGEEQLPSIANVRPLARLFGMPAFPIIPHVLMGLPVPLPTRYRLWFGEPLKFSGDPDDDDSVIEQKVAVVKQTIQSMLHHGLKERKSIFW
ncbi:MAG: acyltransferase family protein [Myxococcota bacterium]|nr:acyltransferase family protein [Myxococcota bacterium]